MPAPKSDKRMYLKDVRISGKVLLQGLELGRVAFDLHTPPTVIADEVAGVAEMHSIPSSELDATLIVRSDDIEQPLQHTVFSALRIDVGRMLEQKDALRLATVVNTGFYRRHSGSPSTPPSISATALELVHYELRMR